MIIGELNPRRSNNLAMVDKIVRLVSTEIVGELMVKWNMSVDGVYDNPSI